MPLKSVYKIYGPKCKFDELYFCYFDMSIDMARKTQYFEDTLGVLNLIWWTVPESGAGVLLVENCSLKGVLLAVLLWLITTQPRFWKK